MRAATVAAGVRLSLTTLTVLPVRATRADRDAGGVAMTVAPAVGALLGLVLGGVLEGLGALGAPRAVAAALTVGVAALLTRGLHLDGLADTVDALGSYRRGAEGLAVMKKPDIGPFGVAAIVVALLVQAAALASAGFGAVVAAWAAGRLGATVACRRGVPAARPEGLGALVAGTVPAPVAVLATLVVAAGAAFAVPGRPWQGPVAVAVALLAGYGLVRHAVRRFGGITGDVLGAVIEVGTTLALVVLTLS